MRTITVGDHEVCGVLENPSEESLVILVHGFTGSLHGPSSVFEMLSNHLQDAGFAVFRFNFRGTPPSDMAFQEMTVGTETADLEAVVEHVRGLGYDEVSVVAESMGGTVVAKALPQRFASLVFWYPAFCLADTSLTAFLEEPAREALRRDGYVEDGFRVGKAFIDEIRNVDVYDELASVEAPALFVHGDEDDDVPVEQSRRGSGIVGDSAELSVLHGAEHCFRDVQGEAVQVTTSFLRRHC